MFTYQNKNWQAPPSAGELNQRLEIVSVINTIDAEGYPEETSVSVCECWGQAIISGDAAYEAANAATETGAYLFTIRWRNDVKVGMYVHFEGKYYLINALNDFDNKKAFLGMKTSVSEVMSM